MIRGPYYELFFSVNKVQWKTRLVIRHSTHTCVKIRNRGNSFVSRIENFTQIRRIIVCDVKEPAMIPSARLASRNYYFHSNIVLVCEILKMSDGQTDDFHENSGNTGRVDQNFYNFILDWALSFTEMFAL